MLPLNKTKTMKKLAIIVLCSLSLYASAQSSNNDKIFNLLVKFTVKPEAVKEFKQASIKSLIESRKEAGNIEMKFYSDDNKDNVFYVYSRWDNAASYDHHKILPHSQNIKKVAMASLLAPPEIMSLGLNNTTPVRGTKQVNPEDKEKTLFFIFKAKDGYRNQIIKRFETHVKNSRTEEGNIFFEFYTIDGEENTFVVYEKWRSISALNDIHLKTDYSKITGELLGEAMIGEMGQYMSFITELEPNTDEMITKNWELEGFALPESVVADPNSNWLYVSNIVNRETPGYISRISKNGEVDNYKWLEGLNQPCGLAIFDNKLYVGDQNKVHIIDIAKAKIISSLSTEGAMTLNDVAISKNGKVFISDVATGRIYTIENNKLVVWIEKTEFAHPNGIYIENNKLMVANLGEELNPNFSPKIPGSLYEVNIADKKVKLINTSYRLGGLDGVVKVGNKYIVTDNAGGKLYAVSETERILLSSLTPGIADLGVEGQTIYIPYFAGTVSSYSVKTEAKDLLKKGTFEQIKIKDVTIHAYQTKDMMNDYVLMIEKAGKTVMIESPAFWDNFNELRTYITANSLKIDAIMPSYHPLGATFINTKELANMDIYFTQHVLDYWEKGFGAVMKAGIPQAFGDKVDASFYTPTVMLKEGETEVAGIKMILRKSYDGFDIEMPEINTVYVHILGHDTHSEILGEEHLKSSIKNFKRYLSEGYTTFLSSHHAPETKADMEEKLAYLKQLQKIIKKSHTAEEFTENMKAAYPNYKEGYLAATTRSFFGNETNNHKH